MSTVGHTMRLGGTKDEPTIVDPSGRPARQAVEIPRCPQCHVQCPKGDTTRRTRSGGFGTAVHDVCVACGYDFEGELTV